MRIMYLGSLIWLPLVINKQLGYSIYVLPYQHYLASIGPMLAAIIITLYYGGLVGLKEFIINIFAIKGRSIWILFGVISSVVMFIIAIVINFVSTGIIAILLSVIVIIMTIVVIPKIKREKIIV